MTWKELEKKEAMLAENGYIRDNNRGDYMPGDYYWWKSWGRDKNPYEENRSLYSVIISVFDWREYRDIDPYIETHTQDASLMVNFGISRTIDETLIKLSFDIGDNELDLPLIETRARAFYEYIEANFEVPKEKTF